MTIGKKVMIVTLVGHMGIRYLNACHGDIPCEYEHEGKPQQEYIHLEEYRQWHFKLSIANLQ